MRWPFRDILDRGKGIRPDFGPGDTLRGEFLERDLNDHPNRATLTAAEETGGLRASGLNQGI